MKTDSIGRRLRNARQPKRDAVHTINERDLEWLAFLHRHGGRLPTSYLHDSTKGTHRSMDWTRRRLMQLFNELSVIDRPHQQFETLDPRYNELVHEISNKGLAILKDEGKFSEYAPSMRGSFKHQLMLSCISASFELNSRDVGYGYIPQHVFLERLGKDHHITLDSGTFTPDEVFMLTIDGRNLLLFLEVDRGTEPTETDTTARKSWTRSVAQYRELIGHKKYQERFGVNCGALLLVVTISAAKQTGILKAVEKEFNGGCNYILTHYLPEFGRIFHPPLLLDMLNVEWQRCGHAPFRLHK